MPGPDRLDVSVLVPVLNEAANLRDAAAAMLSQRFDGSYEVLFIDGGSDDGTPELVAELAREDPRVRLLENPARVTPAALNIGLRAARGDVIVRMDAHTFYPPDYLDVGLRRLRRGDVTWVSGAALPQHADAGSRRVALALGSILGTGGSSFRAASAEEHDAITGFTGLFDRATLERLGGWDEGWPINQDSELGARWIEAGERIVVLPELAAGYVPRSSLRALARQYARYGFYRCKTTLRHPWTLRRPHLLPPAVTLTAVGAALPGPQRRLARLGAVLYGVALAGTTVSTGRRRDVDPRDAASLPAVLTTMHFSWGLGFLVGALRLGPPVAAVAGLVRPTAARPRPESRSGRG